MGLSATNFKPRGESTMGTTFRPTRRRLTGMLSRMIAWQSTSLNSPDFSSCSRGIGLPTSPPLFGVPSRSEAESSSRPWRWAGTAFDRATSRPSWETTLVAGALAQARTSSGARRRHISSPSRLSRSKNLSSRSPQCVNAKGGTLARTSHRLSAAAGGACLPVVFCHFGVLDVLASTTPRPSDR